MLHLLKVSLTHLKYPLSQLYLMLGVRKVHFSLCSCVRYCVLTPVSIVVNHVHSIRYFCSIFFPSLVLSVSCLTTSNMRLPSTQLLSNLQQLIKMKELILAGSRPLTACFLILFYLYVLKPVSSV